MICKGALVVDLDGTLTAADTLIESVIQVIKLSPLNVFRLLLWALRGRAAFKSEVANLARISPEHLPYRTEVLDFLIAEKASGRRLILATAAHRSIAEAVADHLKLFDYVLATDNNVNLKGHVKLDAIRASTNDDFTYAGDSRADVPIWEGAKAAVLVGVRRDVANTVRRTTQIEKEFIYRVVGAREWFRALRVHQWLKNLLLFVPLLTAFSFTQLPSLISIAMAFVAFSLTASATYIVNDLWDLESDRAHPRKRRRPFASARIPVLHGVSAAGILLLLGLTCALTVSTSFFAVLVGYVVLTSVYSWILKEIILLDVLTLSMLYTIRIFAGAVAIRVHTSSWLLAFSMFVFLSLALVKRCSELVSLRQSGGTSVKGRDYRLDDLVVLWPLGVGAALSSVVVFELFANAADTQARYSFPDFLWLVSIALIYWLARLWIKTSRGEMHDDPIVYTIVDRGSRLIVAAMIAAMLIARFVPVSL